MSHSTEWLSGPMTEDMLQQIFTSDQDMYPAPLTYARLKSWVEGCPELSQCFYLKSDAESETSNDKAVGAVIVLPMIETAWRNLLDGVLRETDIDVPSAFPLSDDHPHAVGLHVFHVERFDPRAKGLAAKSLRYAQQVAEAKGWDVLGYSALTATEEGAQSFQKLGFVATGYEELWIESNDEIRLVAIYPGQGGASSNTNTRTGSILGQARMTVRFSNTQEQEFHQ